MKMDKSTGIEFKAFEKENQALRIVVNAVERLQEEKEGYLQELKSLREEYNLLLDTSRKLYADNKKLNSTVTRLREVIVWQNINQQ